MFSRAFVNAWAICLKSHKSNVTVNLGQSNMTIKDAIEKIAGILGKRVSIKTSALRKDQKYIHFEYDSDFNEAFDFKPKYSFEAGIKELADFLREKNED